MARPRSYPLVVDPVVQQHEADQHVITVSGSFEQAYTSSREYFDLASTAANTAELRQLRATVAECHPDPDKPSQVPTFIVTEETKPVAVDTDDPTKTIRIGAQLSAK